MHTLNGLALQRVAPSRAALRGQRVHAAPRAARPAAVCRAVRADAEPAKQPTPAVLLNAVPLPAAPAHVTCGTDPVIWHAQS